MPRRVRLRTYKRVRSKGYRVVRSMGNWQPWLELLLLDSKAPRKIIRRVIHRKLGKLFSKQLFGSGFIARSIKGILGL